MVTHYMKMAHFGPEIKEKPFVERVVQHVAMVLRNKQIGFDVLTCMNLGD